MPLVSIVMLTYNHEKYIRQAIESILMQEVAFQYEIIIGDDASKDSTQDILLEYKKKYPDIVHLILREQNIGPTKNLYDVLKRCQGKYIAYLEGDDYWIDKDKLKKQIEILESSNYIAVAHGNTNVDVEGNIKGYSVESKVRIKLKMKNLIGTGWLFHTATVVHKNIFLDSSDNYKIIYEAHPLIGDLTISCILFDKGDILFIPDVMSVYRDNNLSSGENASSIIRRDYINSYISILSMHDRLNKFFLYKYNFDNLKVIRTVELLCTYYLHKPFSKSELQKFMKKINFKIKIEAYAITLARGIKYCSKKLI